MKRFFFTRAPSQHIRRRNLDFYPVRYELGTSLLTLLQLRRRIANSRPDVLHLHTQGLAYFAAALHGIPTVISADMTARQMARQQAPDGWGWTYAPNRLLEGRAFRAAAAVVTFSRWAATAVSTDYGIEPDRVHVIPPGVELERFRTIAAARPHEANAPVRILFVGGEFERKGGLDLIHAFVDRFGTDLDVELHIVTNDGVICAHPNIFVHNGITPFSRQWELAYEQADVFVLPTRGDASPHVLVEAQAAGLPVICTDVGACAEVIDNGRTGYVIPSGDVRTLAERLELLVRDAARRRQFGASGARAASARFDASVNMRALEELFVRVSLNESNRYAGAPAHRRHETTGQVVG